MTNMFLAVLGISASVSLIVAALILSAPILNRRYAAKWKYFIWIFLALRLLVPLSGTSGRLPAGMAQTKTRAAWKSEEKQADALDNAHAPAQPGRIIIEIPAQMTVPIAAGAEKRDGGITLLDILAFVWMAGSLIYILVHLCSYLHYKKQVLEKGTIIKNPRVLCQMSRLKQELDIKCAVYAVEYDKAASPMVMGFRRHVLVLPKEQYDRKELFFILKHELVHLKRKDVYLKLLFAAANAVHWFNPLIWIMQKEAVIDMELSCDERVVQGTDYAVRRAYTETLLSMLHKRCAGQAAFTTQFYGGKKIMKKRFQNILGKKGKKNGTPIFIGAVVLTISLGTLTGCSAGSKDAKDAGSISSRAAGGRVSLEYVSSNGGERALTNRQDENISGKQETPADNPASKNAVTFMFSKEGETEKKQAALMAGNGYSIYLPENEWKQSGSDAWAAVVNEQVQVWVTHFKDAGIREIAQKLSDNGYEMSGDDRIKREGEMIYKVRLNEAEGDVWGVYYCYPAEAEEGWGRELPVIADTFAVSAQAGNGKSA